MTDLVLTNIARLVTNRPDADDLIGLVEDAALIVREGTVTWAGSRADLADDGAGAEVIDCGGRAVIPGFVDAHTHLVFAGDRADEFGRRLSGESYEDILAAGGGILSTVRATRAATVEELVADAEQRAARMLAAGTTTLEVKSGYGLDTETEIRQLRAAARIGAHVPIDVEPTFLGAHVLPAEYRGDREGYLNLIEQAMLPACAPLARFCDVFCDDAAFTVEEARQILEAGRRHGLLPRLHADQLSRSGGARLAAELSAASADHLDHAAREDLQALGEAGTVAVLLPAVSLSMRLPYPDGRRIWDSGVVVALATDCNPGTSYVESMPLVIALACLQMGLTPNEAIWAATRGGALALQLADKGMITAGAVADLLILADDSHVHIPYRPGWNPVWKVIKGGRIVVDHERQRQET